MVITDINRLYNNKIDKTGHFCWPSNQYANTLQYTFNIITIVNLHFVNIQLYLHSKWVTFELKCQYFQDIITKISLLLLILLTGQH